MIAVTAGFAGFIVHLSKFSKVASEAAQASEELTIIQKASAGWDVLTAQIAKYAFKLKDTAVAQAFLNSQIAATLAIAAPYIAIIAGITLGAYALDKANKKWGGSLSNDAAFQKASKNIDAYSKKLKSMEKGTQSNLSSASGDANYYSALYDQLMDITDANGKVKKGEEARAQFITGTLNSALGTNMQLQNGIITGLNGEKGAVEKLIKAKQAEAILEAYKDDYVQALKDREKAEKNYQTAYEKNKKAQAKAAKTGSTADAKAAQQSQKALDKATANLHKNAKAQEKYTKAMKLAAEGKTDEIIKLSNQEIDTADDVTSKHYASSKKKVKAINKEIDAINTQIDGYKNLQKGVNKNSDEYKEYQSQIDKLKTKKGELTTALDSEKAAMKSNGDATKKAGDKMSTASVKATNLKNTLRSGWSINLSGVFSSLNSLITKAGQAREAVRKASGGGTKGVNATSTKGYAKGGEAEGGMSLVGEEGREIVKRKGNAYIVGARGAEIVNLQKGDFVYTNAQTERMLKGKKSSPKLMARADGTRKDVLDHYFDNEEERFTKGQTNHSRYYDATTWNAKYYVSHGLITAEEYKDSMEDSVSTLFSTMDDLYEAGAISTQEYYENLIKYANGYKSKGALTIKEYFDYISKAKDTLVDSIKDDLDKIETKTGGVVESLEAKFGAFSTYAEEQKTILQGQLDVLDAKESALNGTDLAGLQKNLETAQNSKNVRVYSAAKGWQYEADQSAVDEAQKAIDEYNLNQEKQAIQNQIDAYDNFLNEQETYLNKYIQELELGQSIEEVVFKDREHNFTNFKESYLDYMKDMLKAEDEYVAAQKENSLVSNADNLYVAMSKSGKIYYSTTSQAAANKLAGLAKGTLAVSNSGMYNVNELGDELFVPPTGNASYLQKGTGVIPAGLTQNLMELGHYNLNELANKIGSYSGDNNDNHSVNIENLTVQSNNANDFVRQLQNLSIVSK